MTDPFAPGVHPQRRPTVWLRRTDGEIAAYDRKRGRVHLLNETALAIWELCDGRTTAEEMVTAICELFHMPRRVVVGDVERALLEFDRASLVAWVG